MVERTTVQSFALEALPMVKKLNPKLKTSALFKPSYFQGFLMAIGLDSNRAEIIQKTEKAGADYISPHYRYISPSFVQTCHKKNIRVIPWTVNEEETMLTLLDYGVDGIISDYPNRLFKVYQEWSSSRLKLVSQSR
jgi:glycerophosphoryl diester phosphodiesterase